MIEAGKISDISIAGNVAAEKREQYAKRKGARQYLKPQRKPNVIATSPFAFSLVYDAIKSGSRTREAIRRTTKLDYDSIGEAILELWEVKGIKIERLPEGRQFVAA